MVSVAKMLRTTVKKLLDINPDIKDPASKCHLCVCVHQSVQAAMSLHTRLHSY